jgi:PAS domain S-box-containing protein
VAANKPFCQALGRPEEDLVGKTDYDLYPPELAEKYRRDDRVVLTEGRRREAEEETLVGGQMRTVRVVKTPVKDNQGRSVGVLGIFWDVTEQRHLEAQLRQAQKMEAVGQLAGGVAHDFNNLLTAILGNLSLILANLSPTDPNREQAALAEQAAWRAAELTRQLLDFSRQRVLRPQFLQLNTVIDELVNLLRRTIDPLITVEVRCAADLWPVQADPGQMNQVLMNLCLNARDAMPEGGRLLLEATNVVLDEAYTRLHLDARPGDFVRLHVCDTGQGIPPEVLPRIFDPFFTTKEPSKGTGLGLAIVFGIIQQHQGWIECHSVVNHGTRFDIYLPRSVEADPLASASLTSTLRYGGTETILLVDDEPLIRDLGRTILQQGGYRVLLAEDGKAALDLYRREREHIDLVILDLTMPQLSGRETLRKLRRINPAVRILFASGYFAEPLPEAADGFRVNIVAKPYRPDELTRMVRAVLDGRPAEAGSQPVPSSPAPTRSG